MIELQFTVTVTVLLVSVSGVPASSSHDTVAVFVQGPIGLCATAGAKLRPDDQC